MNDTRFPPVESGYPFPRLELEVLDYWRRERIFQRTLERTANGPEFVFYEGPPTANNTPHVGHVVTRVVKDLVPRYRTMRGDFVARKGGWDTHGLPVEIEVEKRLGFTGKKQIEDYGIAEFNRRCLESVDVYEKQWREMVERVGHWIDLDHPYLTYTNDYIESVWWALATLANRGLLERGYKIQHYCGRCGTPLSSHEVAQNYKDVDDPSVWVLFPLRDGQSAVDTDGVNRPLDAGVKLVAWTTTPWTLLSHAGLAVNPKLTYRLVRHPARTDLLIFAEGLEQAGAVPHARRRRQDAPRSISARARPSRASRDSHSSGCATTGRCAWRPARATPTPATTSRPTRWDGWWSRATTSPPPTAPASSTPRRCSARTTTGPDRPSDCRSSRRSMPPARSARAPVSTPGPASGSRTRTRRSSPSSSAPAGCSITIATATATRSAGAATSRYCSTPPTVGSSAPRSGRSA